MFSRTHQGLFTFVLAWMDDLLITRDDDEGIAQLKRDLQSAFTIKDLGITRYFLGIGISKSPKGALLNQRKYVLDILIDVGLIGAKSKKFSLLKALKLSTNQAMVYQTLNPIKESLEDCCTSLYLGLISLILYNI